MLATRVSGWPKADGPPSIDTDTARAALPMVNVNGDDRAAPKSALPGKLATAV